MNATTLKKLEEVRQRLEEKAPAPKNIAVSLQIKPGHEKMPFSGLFRANTRTLLQTEKMSKADLIATLSGEFSTTGGAGELDEAAVKKVLKSYPRAVLEIIWGDTFGGA